MAETPDHRDNLSYLVEELRVWFADEEWVYVSGNMFIYYEKDNRLRHVAPDVFAVRGIRKQVLPRRRRYLVWEEGKGPDAAIELTSESTREEDLEDKLLLYQDVLKVSEYFLFDPHGDYLDPPLRGYRLVEGQYVRIEPVAGRLPSEVLGLHLEADDWQLRLYNPATGKWLPTPPEVHEALQTKEEELVRAEIARQAAEKDKAQEKAARQEAEKDKAQEKAARQQAEAELVRLREELETLRQQLPKPPEGQYTGLDRTS